MCTGCTGDEVCHPGLPGRGIVLVVGIGRDQVLRISLHAGLHVLVPGLGYLLVKHLRTERKDRLCIDFATVLVSG